MRVVLTILLSAMLPAPAAADAITTLYGSGLDGSGNPLTLGAIDLDYTVLETGLSPVAVTKLNHYLPNDSASQWIGETELGQPTHVTRTYRTTFDLSGFDPASALITGMWGVDNYGDDILINGISTGFSLPNYTLDNFQRLHAFTIDFGFQSGINTLDFIVTDAGVRAGLRTQLSGTANPVAVGGVTTAVPEPSSLLLLSVGMAMVAYRRVRQ